MTARLNDIHYPDTAKCPSCGRPIDGGRDPLGVIYQCTAMDCMETYSGEELFPREQPAPDKTFRPAPGVHHIGLTTIQGPPDYIARKLDTLAALFARAAEKETRA